MSPSSRSSVKRFLLDRFPRPALSRAATLRSAEMMGAVGHLVSSLEYLVDERDRQPGGLSDYEPIRTRLAAMGVGARGRPIRRLINFVSDRRVTHLLHVGRVAAAVTVLLPAPRRVHAGADLFLAASQAAMTPRNTIGLDGSDQAAFLVHSIVGVARAGQRNNSLVDACLWGVALHAALSYGVSGWTKLFGREWRSGEALGKILRTVTYGDQWAWRLARRRPAAARLLCRAVVAVEAAFPVVLAGPARPLAPLFVGGALSFHLANARLMGLNRFLFAFSAMHPCLLYVTRPPVLTDHAGRPLEHRDDLVARLAVVVGAAGAVAATVDTYRRRGRVRRGHPDERTMTTPSGNMLRYRITGEPDRCDAPLIVCESGLGASGDQWEWLRRELPHRWSVLTYHRAGLGGSTRASSAAWTPMEAVNDLRSLVALVRDGRPVVLLGHSLGGYLVALAAQEGLQGQLAVVLLDASHPETLIDEDTAGAKTTREVMAERAFWVRLGLGALLDVPGTMRALPPQVRALVIDQTRDHSTWTTTRRELTGALQAARTIPFTGAGIATLAVCAALSVHDNPRHGEVQRALAEATPSSEYHVIGGTTHHSLVHTQAHARRVAALVTSFVERLDRPVSPEGSAWSA